MLIRVLKWGEVFDRVQQPVPVLCRGARSTTTLALAAAVCLASSSGWSGVGLPSYEGPDVNAPTSETRPAQAMVFKPINFSPATDSAALDCRDAASLDLAPPADPRAEGHEAEASARTLPLYIDSRRAALRTGEVVNELEALNTGSQTILISDEDNYLERLQSITSGDQLLVQTPTHLTRYRVVSTGLTLTGLLNASEPPEDREVSNGIRFAACYPFQPAGRSDLVYQVEALPLPLPLPHPSANEAGGRYETVNF